MNEYYFDGQRDGEKVIFVWRRNLWTIFKPTLLVIVLSWIVIYFLIHFGASKVTSIAIAIWLVIVPIIIGYTWFIWWNDLYILTNQRIIDIDQRRIFHRVVAEIPIENVQDVTFEVKGIWATLLNIGSVQVQTASGQTIINIVGVSDPLAVQQAILRQTAERNRSS